MIVCFLSFLFGSEGPPRRATLAGSATMTLATLAEVGARLPIGAGERRQASVTAAPSSALYQPDPSAIKYSGEFVVANPYLNAICREIEDSCPYLIKLAKAAGVVAFGQDENTRAYGYRLHRDPIKRACHFLDRLKNIPTQRAIVSFAGTTCSLLAAFGTVYLALPLYLSLVPIDPNIATSITVVSAILSTFASFEAVLNAVTLDRSLDKATKDLATCFQICHEIVNRIEDPASHGSTLPHGFRHLRDMQAAFFMPYQYPLPNLFSFAMEHNLLEETQTGHVLRDDERNALRESLDRGYEKLRGMHNFTFSTVGITGMISVIFNIVWYIYFKNVQPALVNQSNSINGTNFSNSTFSPKSNQENYPFSVLNLISPSVCCFVALIRLFDWFLLSRISENDEDSSMLHQIEKNSRFLRPESQHHREATQEGSLPFPIASTETPFRAFQSPTPTPRFTSIADRLAAAEINAQPPISTEMRRRGSFGSAA